MRTLSGCFSAWNDQDNDTRREILRSARVAEAEKHWSDGQALGPPAPRKAYHHVRARPDGTILRVTGLPSPS